MQTGTERGAGAAEDGADRQRAGALHASASSQYSAAAQVQPGWTRRLSELRTERVPGANACQGVEPAAGEPGWSLRVRLPSHSDRGTFRLCPLSGQTALEGDRTPV